MYPSNVKDGYTADLSASMSFKPEGSEEVTATTNTITMNYNISAKISSVSKSASYSGTTYKYETWQSTWGDKPADADDYVFVVWRIATATSGIQPYTLIITENPGSNVELVGYGSNVSNANKYSVFPVRFNSANPLTNTSRSNVVFVLTKIKRSALESEATIKNDCTVTLVGRDGASDEKSASASYTYVNTKFQCPPGAVSAYKSRYDLSCSGYLNKLEKAASAGGVNTVGVLFNNSSYDFYLRTEAIALAYTLKEGADPSEYDSYGVTEYSVITSDDSMKLGNEALTDDDYQFVKVYFYNTEYNYTKNVNTGVWPYTSNTNYTSYKPSELQIRMSGSSDWVTIGTLTQTSANTFILTDAEGNQQTIKSNAALELMQNVVGLRVIQHSTNARTYFNMYLETTLKTTDHVLSLTNGVDSINLTNYGNSAIIDATDTQVKSSSASSYTQLKKYVTSSSLVKNATYTNDTSHSKVDAAYTITLQETLTHAGDTYEAIVETGAFKEQKSGIIYDLLPSGMQPDLSTISLKGNTASSSAGTIKYGVELVDNWKNSGRTMMIVDYLIDSSNYTRNSSSLYSKLILTYKAYYPWDSIADYGSTPRNTVGVHSNQGLSGSSVHSDDGTGAYADDQVYMSDLNEDGSTTDGEGSYIYAYVQKAFDFVTSAELGYSKRVKAAGDTAYQLTTETLAGGDYYYRLRMGSEVGIKTSDIVFYDVLETYNPDETNRWSGTFAGIDISNPVSKGVDVKVYYSTVKGLVMSATAAMKDLTDTSIWSTVAPDDLSQVTAIAFDLRTKTDGTPFVLDAQETVNVVIQMKAPYKDAQKLAESGALALNSAWQSCTATSKVTGDVISDTLECKNTEVTLSVPEVAITKASDPSTGTASAPSEVKTGDSLDYELQVTNSENTTLTNVVVVDEIPTGLTINGDIQFSSNVDEKQKADGTNGVTASVSGNKVTITIDSLSVGNVFHLYIPTQVTTYRTTTFDNTAHIVSVNKADTDYKSETTYHKISEVLFSIPVSKIWADNNDQDGMRIDQVTIHLLKDGAASSEVIYEASVVCVTRG